MLSVVLLDVLDFDGVRSFGVVDDRLHVIFKLLHDVLVLELGDVAIFTLDVGVEQGTLLLRMTVLKAFIPAQTLELQIEVQNEERVSEVDVGKASIVACSQVHGQVEVVKRVEVCLLDHLQEV